MSNHLDLKASIGVDDAGLITGIAWPFGVPDRTGDMIKPGAFKGVVPPIPMLFGHDQNDPVGVWTEAVEASDGLRLKGRLLVDDVARAREVRALVQSGAAKGLSIGFITRKAAPRSGGGRTISALDLVEVSIVTVPMHPGALITGAKSAASAQALAAAIRKATAAIKGA